MGPSFITNQALEERCRSAQMPLVRQLLQTYQHLLEATCSLVIYKVEFIKFQDEWMIINYFLICATSIRSVNSLLCEVFFSPFHPKITSFICFKYPSYWCVTFSWLFEAAKCNILMSVKVFPAINLTDSQSGSGGGGWLWWHYEVSLVII